VLLNLSFNGSPGVSLLLQNGMQIYQLGLCCMVSIHQRSVINIKMDAIKKYFIRIL
jgi:hypothetical protein